MEDDSPAVISADRPLVNRRILLAVTGSVAACKADRIIRELTDRGAEVQVLLTESGARFFPPQTAGSLTDYPVVRGQFDADDPGTMRHIDLKNETDCVLVAPATANRLLNLDHPRADDTLGTLLVAFSGPVLYAPAMNPDMWANERLQSTLEEHRDRVVEPEEGTMACGETGPGRLPDPETIAEAVTARLWPSPLEGTRPVVSGGPTREAVDEVRHLTNRSTGKMGEALAHLGARLGGEVTLVTGADRNFYGPSSYELSRVNTTAEMNEAVRAALADADLYVGAAAVSDYRPRAEDGKISSGQEDLTLELEPTADILTGLNEDFPEKTLVGFSADDSENPDRALRKAEKKGLDAIVFNSINQDDGAFGSESNRATLCFSSGEQIALGHRSKPSLALQVWIGLLRQNLV